MSLTKAIGRAGLWYPTWGGIGWNRTGSAVAAGDCLMMDLAATATETTGNTTGENGKLGNWIAPLTDGLLSNIFCIVTEPAADDAIFRFVLQGLVRAKVDAGLLDGTDAYDVLAAQNGEKVLGARGVDGASGGIGLLLENTSSGDDVLAWILFWGYAFVGTTNDAA